MNSYKDGFICLCSHRGVYCSILFPKEWRGRRNEELSQISGIPGCIYVHDFGYIGGNHTYEGALAMAKKALSSLQNQMRTIYQLNGRVYVHFPNNNIICCVECKMS